MIRYKKVLKALTKEHFTNIISVALGLPAGFRPRPCAAMKSGVRGAIFLARAHFLPNEYNKNPRGDISVKIGISPNRSDGRKASKSTPTFSALPRGGGRFAVPRGHHSQLATASRSGTRGTKQVCGEFQQRRADSAGPGFSLSSPRLKKTVPGSLRDLGGSGTVQHVPP